MTKVVLRGLWGYSKTPTLLARMPRHMYKKNCQLKGQKALPTSQEVRPEPAKTPPNLKKAGIYIPSLKLTSKRT